MKQWRVGLSLMWALAALGLLALIMSPSLAAGTEPTEVGLVVPLGKAQTDLRAAYRAAFTHLYDGGQVRWAAAFSGDEAPAPVGMGDLVLPGLTVQGAYTAHAYSGSLTLNRAFALHPKRIAVLRSTATIPIGDGEGVAMWEIAEIRQVFEGYLMGAVPYDVLTETEVAQRLDDYGLLIIPTFNPQARDDVLAQLSESGALDTIRTFVEGGGTLYAQSSGLWLAEQAGLLPEGMVDLDYRIRLMSPDDIANQGRLQVLLPDSPLAYGWLTDSLYILDDPTLWPDETTEIIAEIVNAEEGNAPAIIRRPVGAGQVIGIVGHPTDATRRHEIPLFLDAVMTALAGRVAFYGDAVQTFSPAMPPHEFPAYETVPVSVTLHVENLWDGVQHEAVVVEHVAPGYTVLTATIRPSPTALTASPEGETVITWTLGDLPSHARFVLHYQAETDPQALAAGRGTFSRGWIRYDDFAPQTAILPTADRPTRVEHLPFILTARMAARLVGDRDVEADRHYRIPAQGLYLDVALPLENKEETLASSLVMTDWVYLIVPIVDVEDQRIILSTNDGETIWVRNEPFLWGNKYPLWEGASAPTETLTLANWRALPPDERPRCVFTSPYGIHIDPLLRATGSVTDSGSFITIPPTYTDAITVTPSGELLLPCLPMRWKLGDFPGYWYEEPIVRYGVHSRELLGREVVFHGTPREGTVVLPYDAGSVYVLAGTYPVPYREYLAHEFPYSAQAPAPSILTYRDIWERLHTLTFRASFYDVWDWDTCTTCDVRDQHAGVALTYGLWADVDGDEEAEFVREIPSRLRTRLVLQAKTRSATLGDWGGTLIPPDQNLIDLPIFHGLGVRIEPEGETWWDSYTPLAPGYATLITVVQSAAYDHLYFQQQIPVGSTATFVVTATISPYAGVNKEADTKIHDGARLAYRQMAAGINRYEIYDSHVHAPEALASNGVVAKRAGPMLISVYSDTVFYAYTVWDRYDARDFARDYDPFIKSWGYGDLVWTTYVGGREGKTLFSSVLGPGDRTRLRIALDNATGVTLTGVTVTPEPPPGIRVTQLYTDPTTAPEPIWPELAFLNQAVIPDAGRGVWYFEIEVEDDLPPALWGKVIEIPIVATADNFPTEMPYDEVPAARLALRRPGDPAPRYASGVATDVTLADRLPANVTLQAAAWTTDVTVIRDLWAALDVDSGHALSNTAAALFQAMVPTRAFTLPFTLDEENVVHFQLPTEAQHLPMNDADALYVIAQGEMLNGHHGPNTVNLGATLCYTDTFGMQWCDGTSPVAVEAHGASVWVDYFCDGGWSGSEMPASARVMSIGGECVIPDDGPAEVVMEVTAYNAGDAIARSVTVTLELPEWVTATDALPRWSAIEDNHLIWTLGDLAPGQWKQFTIILYVEPYYGDEEWGLRAAAALPTARRVLGVRSTKGTFFDDYSRRWISGPVGTQLWFGVATMQWRVYLPVVLRYSSWWPGR